jgi:hypothetical protein
MGRNPRAKNIRGGGNRRVMWPGIPSRDIFMRRLLCEALEDRILLAADFGDAPAPYPTLLADNGARHEDSGPMFGASRVADSDGQPTAGANGDDNDGSDDEDGVKFVPGFLAPGDATASVEIDMLNSPDGGRLSAWIDFNADGDWDDAGERIFGNEVLTGGTINALTFAVPADAELGQTFGRFRVSTQGILDYGGWASDGEVEDYRISIATPPDPHGLFAGELFPTGTSPTGLAVADVNGDGIQDLATSNFLSDDVTVLMGQGDGVFATAVSYPIYDRLTDVALADLNHDGHVDMVAVGSNHAWVLRNLGNGTFGPYVDYLVGEKPSAVALDDVNGDGDLDILVTNQRSNNVSVLLGHGNGTFAAQVTYAVGPEVYGPRPEFIELVDVNGDNYLDIVTANDLRNNVSILLGRGDGTFGDFVNYDVGQDPLGLAIADLNGDDYLDIVTVNELDNNASILLGNGDGTFAEQVLVGDLHSPQALALADINHDGILDMVMGLAGAEVGIMLGLGNAEFTPVAAYTSGYQPVCVLPLDTNDDGKLDIVTANSSGSVSVLRGFGNGAFPLPVRESDGDLPRGIAAADFNGDGHEDLVTMNTYSDNVANSDRIRKWEIHRSGALSRRRAPDGSGIGGCE